MKQIILSIAICLVGVKTYSQTKLAKMEIINGVTYVTFSGETDSVREITFRWSKTMRLELLKAKMASLPDGSLAKNEVNQTFLFIKSEIEQEQFKPIKNRKFIVHSKKDWLNFMKHNHTNSEIKEWSDSYQRDKFGNILQNEYNESMAEMEILSDDVDNIKWKY